MARSICCAGVPPSSRFYQYRSFHHGDSPRIAGEKPGESALGPVANGRVNERIQAVQPAGVIKHLHSE